jgi:4-hydroxy-2-oxoheptanedioate aldolase
LCQAESVGAVRAFVESCRYPHHSAGVDPNLPSPIERMHGASREAASGRLGLGARGRGSEMTSARVWGLSPQEYMSCCDPWPLSPRGELLLGVKLESPEGIVNSEEIIAVPGLGFAEMRPGVSASLSATSRSHATPIRRNAAGAGARLCSVRKYHVAFLETATPESIIARLDEGVRVIAGQGERRRLSGAPTKKRTMPV